MSRSPSLTDFDHLVAELALARRNPAPFAYAAHLLDLLDDDVERFLSASEVSGLREGTRLARVAYVRAASVLVALSQVAPAAATPERLAAARKVAQLCLDHYAVLATSRMRARVARELRPAALPRAADLN